MFNKYSNKIHCPILRNKFIFFSIFDGGNLSNIATTNKLQGGVLDGICEEYTDWCWEDHEESIIEAAKKIEKAVRNMPLDEQWAVIKKVDPEFTRKTGDSRSMTIVEYLLKCDMVLDGIEDNDSERYKNELLTLQVSLGHLVNEIQDGRSRNNQLKELAVIFQEDLAKHDSLPSQQKYFEGVIRDILKYPDPTKSDKLATHILYLETFIFNFSSWAQNHRDPYTGELAIADWANQSIEPIKSKLGALKIKSVKGEDVESYKEAARKRLEQIKFIKSQNQTRFRQIVSGFNNTSNVDKRHDYAQKIQEFCSQIQPHVQAIINMYERWGGSYNESNPFQSYYKEAIREWNEWANIQDQTDAILN